MSDFSKLSSIRLTYDKVILTIIIPGITACFPYLMILYREYHPFGDLGTVNSSAAYIAVLTLSSMAIGMILENFGGRIEVHIYDWLQSKNLDDTSRKALVDYWDRFLMLDYRDNEPVGHRYLRDTLLRMKFELSFGIALLIMSCGLIICQCMYSIFDNCCVASLVIGVLPVLLSAYLLREGYSSSKILTRTRKLLVDEFSNTRKDKAEESPGDNPQA